MNLTRIVGFYLEKIFNRYDAENDAHHVTWAENNLAEAMANLTNHVIELTKRVEQLEKSCKNSA